jgi:hypothetical protein
MEFKRNFSVAHFWASLPASASFSLPQKNAPLVDFSLLFAQITQTVPQQIKRFDSSADA